MSALYLHLLEDQPAMFDGEMICYMRPGRYGRRQVLARSIEQIRDEQRRSFNWRKSHGFQDHRDVYGYCIVETP